MQQIDWYNHAEIREACQLHEQQTLDLTGHAVRVTIIKGGRSSNGYIYDEQALRTIAHMIEGAHAYADHSPNDTVTRSVRDIIGFYKDATYIPPGVEAPNGRVDATLHIMEAAGWLWSMIHEACQLGRPELIGLSIDIFGQWQLNETTRAKEITQIVSLNSCDVVTRPSAGGSFQRILHYRLPDAKRSTQCVGCLHNEPLQPLYPEQGVATMPELNPATSLSEIISPVQEAQTADQNHQLIDVQQLEQLRLQVEQQVADIRLQRAELMLERRLQESILPQAVKEHIRLHYSGRIFEEADLERDLNASLTMMAQLARDGIVRGHSYEKADISMQISEAEKIQAAFDRMFDLDIDTARLGNIRGFSSIREAYSRVTGDSSLLGGITGRSILSDIHVSEHAPIARISEADTTTTSFAYLLGTSMNKRLLKDYQAWPAEWAKFVTIAPTIVSFLNPIRVYIVLPFFA